MLIYVYNRRHLLFTVSTTLRTNSKENKSRELWNGVCIRAEIWSDSSLHQQGGRGGCRAGSSIETSMTGAADATIMGAVISHCKALLY